jgi:peroxiredoxin
MTKQIEVSDETYEKIKDQLSADEIIDISSLDDLVGKKLFIRTVTYHMTGRVTKRMGTFIEMEDAAWIADSGRFSNAIKKGVLDEVEPVETMWVNLNSVVDFFPWKHELPKTQK